MIRFLLLSVVALQEHIRCSAAHVHTFYYLWYGTPEIDGNWSHWNHHLIPHWTENIRSQFPPQTVHWLPPHDLHSPFYPLHGPYSSRDLVHARQQMRAMREAGIECAVTSWWGRPGHSKGDSQGVLTDDAIVVAFEAAGLEGMGIALHLEPYEGRSVVSIRQDLEYLFQRFGNHPGLFRTNGKPWFYVYDSYHISSSDWQSLFSIEGNLTVRGTSLDGMFVGLWLEKQHGADLAKAGFDGAYTYFATDGFSYGASSSNWPLMADQARSLNLAFIPCVAPGYDDTRIRPWNSHNIRERKQGEYYRSMWEKALTVNPDYIAITSFNEWGEGTQIEQAEKRGITVEGLAMQGQALSMDVRNQLRLRLLDRYEDYTPHSPSFYLNLTREYASRFLKSHQDL